MGSKLLLTHEDQSSLPVFIAINIFFVKINTVHIPINTVAIQQVQVNSQFVGVRNFQSSGW